MSLKYLWSKSINKKASYYTTFQPRFVRLPPFNFISFSAPILPGSKVGLELAFTEVKGSSRKSNSFSSAQQYWFDQILCTERKLSTLWIPLLLKFNFFIEIYVSPRSSFPSKSCFKYFLPGTYYTDLLLLWPPSLPLIIPILCLTVTTPSVCSTTRMYELSDNLEVLYKV